MAPYGLIISERIHRVGAAFGGAAPKLAIGATDDESAFFSEHSGIDWNVIFLLLGMMMIVGVLKRTGMCEYLAIWAVKRARASPFRVMVMPVVITAMASALLVCERLALVGDPPDIIIASRAGLTFNDFLVRLAPLSAILTVVLVLLCRFLFRKSFVYDETRTVEVMALEEREAIKDPRMLVQGLVVLVLVVAGFVLHPVLHYEPSVVALLGAGR